MTWLALDDTDSVHGGCTTHVAWELLRSLPNADLIGLPRLVRLNPNVPWKTRGNGAVAFQLGHGEGTPRVAGASGDAGIRSYQRGSPLERREIRALWNHAQRLLEAWAQLQDSKTHPGLAIFQARPGDDFYWDAVHRVVDLPRALQLLKRWKARWKGWKNGRGLIGALAAASWPARHGTYEWISYREPARWGTARALDGSLGRELNERFATTFDNYDARHDHLRIEPRSPCPVLAGIRGTDPADLVSAARLLGPEPPAGALLFATNQATDDHLRPRPANAVEPFSSAILLGAVEGPPRVTPGGHVFARLADRTGTVTLAAYEPTKEFRQALRVLGPGDAVEAYGAVHANPHVLALEKLRVIEQAPRHRARPPLCSGCGIRMKSRGRVQGYRCRRCRASVSRAATVYEPEERPDVRGFHEVPVSVRRHLARPLRFSSAPTMGYC